jgi:alkylhydroperoxidase/carboxymuconolactone decarboxylase family protein YurZ
MDFMDCSPSIELQRRLCRRLEGTLISVEQMHEAARELLAEAPDGEPLDRVDATLIAVGVAASVTALDDNAIERAIDDSLAAGATIAQIEEVVALVSGLGVHSLMMTAAHLHARNGDPQPLDPERRAMWARFVGTDPYWTAFDRECPGFLDALLRLSPVTFEGFFRYCAIPWTSNHVRARTKELVALACDACPSHRFMPGFRLHLGNALKLGAGRRAIEAALAIAAHAPIHRGVDQAPLQATFSPARELTLGTTSVASR